jgi:polysaccharide export outer membrane protein
MDTTWRNITVRSRLDCLRFSLLLAGVAFQSLGLTALAQVSGTQSTPTAPVGAGPTPAGARPGVAVPGTGPIALPKDFSQLRIEPGDLVSVDVYDTPELSDAYRVDAAGGLSLPFCGKIEVQGLTSAEAAKRIEVALENDQILVRPQVSVDIQQYAGHFVTVLGEVSSPGRVLVMAATPLSEILAQAGGLTPIAGTHIKIRRAGGGAGAVGPEPEEDEPYARSDSNRKTDAIVIMPGDTVVVPRTGIVYVLGAVYHPGGYVMQEDGQLNAAEALAMSGGTMLTAKTNGLRVIRRGPDGAVEGFELSYDGIAKGSERPLELQAQDIVYVPMSRLKATLTDATALISTAISSAIYASR